MLKPRKFLKRRRLATRFPGEMLMPSGQRMTVYKKALEELKLRQLDVYRFKDHDEVRILANNRVVLVKLPKHREEMTVEEFKSAILSALKQQK